MKEGWTEQGVHWKVEGRTLYLTPPKVEGRVEITVQLPAGIWPETFSFGDVNYAHVVGDAECEHCWSTPLDRHDCGTPGCLEHTQFGDENADCDYWLYHLGDLCRET